jgi:hypothetical protein
MSYSSHILTSGSIGQSGSGPLGLNILSESEFRLFRELIHEECGVSLGEESIPGVQVKTPNG